MRHDWEEPFDELKIRFVERDTALYNHLDELTREIGMDFNIPEHEQG